MNIVNQYGKPFRSPKKLGSFVIAVSADGKPPWRPMHRNNVPEWVQEAEVISNMMDGNMAHNDKLGGGWYICVPTEKTNLAHMFNARDDGELDS